MSDPDLIRRGKQIVDSGRYAPPPDDGGIRTPEGRARLKAEALAAGDVGYLTSEGVVFPEKPPVDGCEGVADAPLNGQHPDDPGPEPPPQDEQPEPLRVVDGAELLDNLAEWWGRFIAVTNPDDLYLLPLWTVHTHLVNELYTTPRLLIDSIMEGSGKSTVIDHLNRLCVRPVAGRRCVISGADTATVTGRDAHDPAR